MKDIFKGYWIELSSRVLSSKKRIIKFFGICLVPILYAIVCILGFWNPIQNLGKAPIAIMDQDNSVWLFRDKGNIIKDFEIGILKDENGNNISLELSKEEAIGKAKLTNGKIRTSTGDYTYKENSGEVFQSSLWNLIKSNLIPKYSNKADEDNKFSSNEIKEGLSLTNISYFSSKEKIDKEWQGKKYYIDLKLNEGIFENIIYKIGTIGRTNVSVQPPKEVKLDIWTTYERNFIFGYYMKSMHDYKIAIIYQLIDKLFDKNSAASIKDEINNGLNSNKTSSYSIKEELIKIIIKYMMGKIDEGLSIVNFDQKGSRNAMYGIGLGEFFICIGLFVGTFMQTFIYDRAKRYTKLNSIKWYMTKTMLMYTTGITQVSLLILALSFTGYNNIGFAGMFSLWLWLLYVDLIFVLTIQALWFLFKDEMISKFIVIIYLVINIAAGSGTFPSFMQFDFFYIISFLSEFRFSIQGIGSIVFSIGEWGFNSSDTIYLLKQASVLAIFGSIMFTLGLLLSNHRNKEIRFGSFNGKQILSAMKELNMQAEMKSFKKENKKGYNWKNMKEDYYPELISKVTELYPFEGQFKWYKKQQDHLVLKPNDSDKETIKRNDTTEV
ncbi:hypothetical protein [Spiroplasma diminutum]|uniref:ABC transporter n=1 Tax=Spiroplasma diminutum CUAS-1 TaxID=1276221 RepID=S5LZF1_9MOLU|nr:hypothetical protein [Spiroplasma diminutum]AGR41966.1 hypothetical protein SDIMI_v3c02620 [Spiroplasma diminutum CUAS-1]